MKKFAFFLLTLCFGFGSQAQTSPCRSIPYAPVFGMALDTSAECKQWTFDQYVPAWGFKTAPGANLNIYYTGQTTGGEYNRLISSCILLDANKRYRLSLNYSGLTALRTNGFKIYLTYKNGEGYWVTDPSQLFLVADFNDLKPGEKELRMIFTTPASVEAPCHLLFQSTSTANQGDFVLSNFQITEAIQNDFELVSVETPNPSCSPNGHTLSVRLRNNGNAVNTNTELCYRLNDLAPVCQTFVTNLPADSVALLAFTQKLDFPQGNSVFDVYLKRSTPDEVTSNDSILDREFYTTNRYDIPYSINFQDAAEDLQWFSLGSETSRISWSIQNGAAEITTGGEAVDDYFISPCLNLKSSQMYRISFEYRALPNSKGENLRLLFGSSSNKNDLKTVLLTLPNFTHSVWHKVYTYVQGPSTGAFHLAFHAYSQELRMGIQVQNLKIEDALLYTTPTYRGYEAFEVEKFLNTVSSGDSNWLLYGANPFAGNTSLRVVPDKKNLGGAWFISLPLQMKANFDYELEFARKANGNTNSERLKVFIGTSPDPVQLEKGIAIWADSTGLRSTWAKAHQAFKLPADGIYYIGFRYLAAQPSALGVSIDELVVMDAGFSDNLRIAHTEVPNSSCSFSESEKKITLTVKNFSASPKSNIVFYTQVNGGTPVASQPVNTIDANVLQNIQLPLNLSGNTIYKVRAWFKASSDIYPKDDSTEIFTIQQLEPLKPTIYNGFESDADLATWVYDKTLIDSWTRLSGSPYKGNTALYSQSSTNTGRASLITPCLDLTTGRTYLVTFFCRAIDTLRPESIKIMQGTNIHLIDQDIASFTQFSKSYRRVSAYFKPLESSVNYLSIIHNSPGSDHSGGVWVDELIIVDSVESARPEMAISNITVFKSTPCSLSPDTLQLTVTNNGFSESPNIQFKLQRSNGQLVEETAYYRVAGGNSITFRANNTWTHSQWGLDSIRVILNMPNEIDRRNDTSAWISLQKIAEQNLPFTANFNTDSGRSIWNQYNGAFRKTYAQPADVDWKMNPGTGGQGNGYATVITTNISGAWLQGPCLHISKEDSLILSYNFSSYRTTSSESLAVYLISEDGQKQTLYTHPNIQNTTSSSNSVRFRCAASGTYRLLFYATGGAKKSGLNLDDISFSVVQVTPPFVPQPDLGQGAWILPQNDTALGESEFLQFQIRNLGNTKMEKAPLSFYLLFDTSTTKVPDWTKMGNLFLIDTVRNLDTATTRTFQTSQSLNMSRVGTYAFCIILKAPGDIRASNDTLRTFVRHLPKKSSILQPLPFDKTAYRLSPNPCSQDHFTLSGSDSEAHQIELFDLNGRRHLREVHHLPATLDIADLSNGMYMVRVDGFGIGLLLVAR